MVRSMKLIDIFFPSNIKCIFCGDEDYKSGICDKCLNNLPYIKGRTCVKCGGHVLKDEIMCRECEKNEHAFFSSYALFDYDGDIKLKINQFKQGEKYLGHTFAHLMSDFYEKLDVKVDLILPMPIHPNRLIERGFNQAEILSEIIKKNHPKLVNNEIFIRVKDTPHQTGLNRDHRLINLSGAFEITNLKKIRNKRILIVDDIYTTGSTLDECAFTLLKAGAKSVMGLCLARGLVYDNDIEQLAR